MTKLRKKVNSRQNIICVCICEGVIKWEGVNEQEGLREREGGDKPYQQKC